MRACVPRCGLTRIPDDCPFTSPDQISSTVAVVLSEYFKSSERTVFWSDDLCRNVDPFEGQDGGFFAADWDFKVCKFIPMFIQSR